jgi:iron complex outermembrane receptor protein
MRKAFTSVILLLFCFATFAQTAKGKISGTFTDNTSKPLQSVSVSLLKASDSSLVKIAVTNKEGNYEFDNINEGNYFLSATSVGRDKTTSEIFSLTASNSPLAIKTLQMTESAKGLTGVTVTAKKPFIEMKIDKTVVNVDASPTSAGATAMEILEKSPGISVDNDGNISLRGKAGVIVMMDGKQTYLSATDLANLLKNTPASSLDQIEIMTNPSSKYDAAGNSGIINIKTKKGKAAGFNGSVMIGATGSTLKYNNNLYVNPRAQTSVNFNYRKNKINFFGSYNPNYFRGGAALTINRQFHDNNNTLTGFSDVATRFKFGNNNHTLKLGMDLYADKKNTFGVVVSGFLFKGHPTPETKTTLSDENHQPTSVLISNTENHINFHNFTSNFNYRHVFDTTGTELTADIDFVTYSNVSNILLTTNFFNGGGQQTSDQLLLRGHLPSDIKIYSAKADFTHPFKKGGNMEAGFKTSYVTNDNLVNYERQVGDKWEADSRSNHFVYDENINAIYLNVNKSVKKWAFQGGLRLENTIAKGHQVTNDSTFKRNFTNLFPTAFISYTANANNTLTFSYSRRVNRPNYQDLNPFTFFLDSLSYRVGNPFLLPQFTHNFELSHSLNNKLITTINYSTTSDVIAQILRQDIQSGIVYATIDNVSKYRNIGIAMTWQQPVVKWWNLNLYTNVFNNRYQGIYDNDPIDISYTSFMVNMTNTFTVSKKMTMELSGWYRGKGVDNLSISQPMYMMNIGGTRQILKGKGTLKLNLRDPFAWQRYAGLTNYGNLYVKINNRWDNRQLSATFTYRFGKSTQQNQPRKRNNSSLDEQSRVGQGGQ